MVPTCKFRQVLRVLKGGKLEPLGRETLIDPIIVVSLQQRHQFEPNDEPSIPRIDFYDGGKWVDVPLCND